MILSSLHWLAWPCTTVPQELFNLHCTSKFLDRESATEALQLMLAPGCAFTKVSRNLETWKHWWGSFGMWSSERFYSMTPAMINQGSPRQSHNSPTWDYIIWSAGMFVFTPTDFTRCDQDLYKLLSSMRILQNHTIVQAIISMESQTVLNYLFLRITGPVHHK